MSEQREMSGILSRNDKRESEKQPEFRGECTIEGKAYRISAWVKEGKSGKFMSLAFDGKKTCTASLQRHRHGDWTGSLRKDAVTRGTEELATGIRWRCEYSKHENAQKDPLHCKPHL